MATLTSPTHDSTPPSHQADPMNYEYPDLDGSVHAIFETQLPGAAIDSPSQTQTSVMSQNAAANRRAEKAPAKEPEPPAFGLFEKSTPSSRDRTQLPFFPATIGSARNSPAPEPATAEQTMMVAICKTTGLMEIFNHKIDDLTNQSYKTNARVNLLSHAMEEIIETLNKNLVAFDKLQKTISNQNSTHRPPTKPAIPLPQKPIPEVVIVRNRTTTQVTSPPNPPTAHVAPITTTTPHAPPTTHTPAATRPIPHRKAREGPKIYLDKPLTPDANPSTPDAIIPSNAGPSKPSYAQAATGEFQPVIRKNRNHRNRPTPTRTPANSPDSQPDRDRQFIVVRHDIEPTLNPSLCLTIVNNIRSRLQYTTCTGTISLVRSSAKGNIVLTTDPKHKAQDLWPYRKQISLGLNDSKIGPFDLNLNLMRLPLYVTNVPLSYPNGGSTNTWHPEDWTDQALELLKTDISTSNAVEAVDRPFTIGTLASLKANKMTHCAFVINLIRSPASLELLRSGHITIGGRRAICREWFPDAHRSYCDRCLSPGHHQIMCRNKSVCKFCKKPHLSNRHRCDTCNSNGFCPAHDHKECYNCNSRVHFAGDEKCPNRTLHKSIDPEEQRGQLHDPNSTGRHPLSSAHPSRFGPPLPSVPSDAISISSDDLDAAIDNNTTSHRDRINRMINDAINLGDIPNTDLIPDEDTGIVDHTDTHWRPCQCPLDQLDRITCPNTKDAIYDISHDHPFCLCPYYSKELRCRFFERFIDEPVTSHTPPDPQLTEIIQQASSEISRQQKRTISITSSGRILIEGIDPDSPNYQEWTTRINYRPHGDLCHCKASPNNNVPRTHCPNRNSEFCPCYHLPGPVAGIIEISNSGKISTRKTTKSTHRIAKNSNTNRALSA